MNKKVVVFAPFFSTDSAQNRPFFVSQILAKYGQVDVVTTDFNHLTKKKREKKQVANISNIIYIKTLPYNSNISIIRFISHILFSKATARYFNENRKKYDIVYVTVPFNLMANLILNQAKNQKKIIDIIDIWPDTLPFPSTLRYLTYPIMKIWKGLFIKTCKKADILMSVSDMFLNHGKKYFNLFLNNAKRFYIGYEKLPELEVKKNKLLTIVYIGNIGHLYDFATLVCALDTELIKKYQIFIIGDGDRKDWFLNQLEKKKINYRYFGVVYEPAKLTTILKSAHLGFNGYTLRTSASFSYKSNIYLAAGLPLINSMGGDLHYLVEKNQIGFNYKAGDYLGLRKILKEIDMTKLEELSFNCTQFFNLNLDHEKITKKMTKFLDNALEIK